MKLKAEGFNTFVYSRSQAPNPKASLVESLGIPYISALDTPLEALAGGSAASIWSTRRWVFHPLPTRSCRSGAQWHLCLHRDTRPQGPHRSRADLIMRNVVLKNQVVVGTVNADGQAFRSAISDLGVFMEKWPETLKSLISRRCTIDQSRNCFWTRQLASRMSFALRRPKGPFRVPDAALGTAQSITRNSFLTLRSQIGILAGR